MRISPTISTGWAGFAIALAAVTLFAGSSPSPAPEHPPPVGSASFRGPNGGTRLGGMTEEQFEISIDRQKGKIDVYGNDPGQAIPRNLTVTLLHDETDTSPVIELRAAPPAPGGEFHFQGNAELALRQGSYSGIELQFDLPGGGRRSLVGPP